ncbi:putative Dynamin-associated protein [Fasciola hepatica]|uniref:Dynamin-associated protein n=1 Tax=Fasciola hepatica TaxID=6192 RepID=A0A4E0R9A3_FASHE|nr:putative Dynamin-associated protein [Fasciola hepatica]
MYAVHICCWPNVHHFFPSGWIRSNRVALSLLKGLSTLASLLGSLVSKRDLVVKELILTEESYVNDLEEVQTVFHEPMRKSMLLTDVQVNRIFLNWSELLVQSKELLSLFIARVDQFVQARSTQTIPPKICIGDILVQQFPKFHVYRVYCARQTTAAEALQTYLDENPRLQQLVRLWEQNTRTKGLPLSTYLLKPMQRLTKYKLLIERILEHTHQSHPDFGSLTKARGLIADVLNSINTAVGTKILDRRIDWLRSRVLGEALALDWLISTAKRPPVERIHLLFYGTVFKIKSNRELIGFLFNRYFLLTSPNFSTGGRCFEFPVPGSNAQTDQTFTVYRQPIPLSEIFVTSGTINDSGGKLFNSLSNLPDSNQATCVKPNSSKSMSKKCGTSSHDLLEDVHLLFSLFRSSKPREPFLTLRAPNPAERDRWVMHLWNAIRKCSGPADADRSQPSRPISNARSECSIFIELVRFWINSTSPLEIRFDCAIDQQPRQSCIASFEPGQPAHLNGPAMKFMHDGNSPPKMCIRAFDHLSWPDERQLGYAEQVLSNINNWDSNGTTQRLALANSDCSLQVEVHLQLVI